MNNIWMSKITSLSDMSIKRVCPKDSRILSAISLHFVILKNLNPEKIMLDRLGLVGSWGVIVIAIAIAIVK